MLSRNIFKSLQVSELVAILEIALTPMKHFKHRLRILSANCFIYRSIPKG